MLIKTGTVQIIEVIKDDDHNLDDKGTKKAMEKAKKVVIEASDEQQDKNTN